MTTTTKKAAGEEEQQPEPDFDVIIVGGGIAGLATAVALSRRGVKRIKVLERARALTPIGAAIGLFPNGLAALEAISPTVYRKVMESCIAIERNVVMDVDHDENNKVLRDIPVGTTTTGSSGSHPSPQYLVWYLLQQYLADEVPSGVFQLGTVVENARQEGDLVCVTTSSRGREDNGDNGDDTYSAKETTTISGRVLIGADGIHSTVRKHLLEDKDPELRYHHKMMIRAVLPLESLPEGVCPAAGTSVAYTGKEKGKLFAFRETAKDIVTITAMARFDDKPNYATDTRARKHNFKELFAGFPRDVQTVMDAVPDASILENAVYSIPVVDKWSTGNIVLVGDSAHAMTPGMGQGANQGLEDAIELAHRLAPLLLLVDAAAAAVDKSTVVAAGLLPRTLEEF